MSAKGNDMLQASLRTNKYQYNIFNSNLLYFGQSITKTRLKFQTETVTMSFNSFKVVKVY